MSPVKLGTAYDDFFKKYDRKFIQLSRDIGMLIHLFEKDKDHSWEDIWLHDFTGIYEHDFFLYKEAAKQFLDQLEGHWSVAFLEALREECDKHIQEHYEKCKKLDEHLKPEDNGTENENV